MFREHFVRGSTQVRSRLRERGEADGYESYDLSSHATGKTHPRRLVREQRDPFCLVSIVILTWEDSQTVVLGSDGLARVRTRCCSKTQILPPNGMGTSRLYFIASKD